MSVPRLKTGKMSGAVINAEGESVGWIIYSEKALTKPQAAEAIRQIEAHDGLDPAILKFAQSMQKKLDANKNKACSKMNPEGKGRSWKECDIYWLLYRLRQETLELEEALYNTDRNAAIGESADAGNFAMMIHDNLFESAEQALKDEPK